MREFSVAFVVTTESPDAMRRVRQQIAGVVQPDSVHTTVARAKDFAHVEHHRIGDYFRSVQIAENSPTSFRLVFAPWPESDRYWKDLVVRVVTSIKDAGAAIRIEK